MKKYDLSGSSVPGFYDYDDSGNMNHPFRELLKPVEQKYCLDLSGCFSDLISPLFCRNFSCFGPAGRRVYAMPA